MQQLKVSFRPEAVSDLEHIFLYVRELSRSDKIAHGFVTRIRERCERIGNVPFGGRPRDDLETGLRIVPFEKSTVIAYVIDGDRVRITNIFYGGQNYESLYRGHPPEGID